MKRHLQILFACALLLTACGGPAASSPAASSAAEPEPVVSAPVAPPAVSKPVEQPEEIKVEMEFTGTVLALTPTTVLVKVDAECDLYETSDQVTFKTRGLEAIEIEEGGRVWVGCTENIRETYPAQVEALTWTALPSQSAEPELAPREVVYDASGDAMRIVIPIGWEYEQADILEESVPAEPETEPADPSAAPAAEPVVIGHTITFWPADDPECRVRLMVEHGAPVIDTAAVTAEERMFPNAGAATVYTQEHDEGHWIYVQFATEDGRYSVRWAPTADQKAAHEETFWTILDTVTVGNEV
ncbi:MAG: hypothetical protein IKM54_04225 [Butyricicoccus sp.]|nr:hypothetical protein [Butyricicoccus sp.]